MSEEYEAPPARELDEHELKQVAGGWIGHVWGCFMGSLIGGSVGYGLAGVGGGAVLGMTAQMPGALFPAVGEMMEELAK